MAERSLFPSPRNPPVREQTVAERRSYYLGAAIVISTVSVTVAGPETQKFSREISCEGQQPGNIC